MPTLDLDDRLIFLNLEVPDTDQLLATLSGALHEAGFVKDSHLEALKKREAAFPTGLPVPGGVAIPHTSADHVLKDTIAVATLASPVTFHEMGGDPEATVEVSTVFLLAFADGTKHVANLSNIVRCIQDAEFIGSIREANDPAPVIAALKARFGN